MQKYQNEPRLNDAYSGNNLPKIKDGAYVISLDEYKSIGSPNSVKLRPVEVLRTSQKASYGRFHMVFYVMPRDVPTNVLRRPYTDVLRTLKYDVLRTPQSNFLGTSPYCPICNAMGRPLSTSRGRIQQTLWGCHHTV